MKSKTVGSILRHVASKLTTADLAAAAASGQAPEKTETHNKGGDAEEEVAVAPGSSEEERLEQLYDQIAWPLGRQYGHPYDAFKLALTCVLAMLIYRINTPLILYVHSVNPTRFSPRYPYSPRRSLYNN